MASVEVTLWPAMPRQMTGMPPEMNITPVDYSTTHESRPWGVYATPGGFAYDIYDFAAHLNFLRMNDPNYIPNDEEVGGAPDGNHYGVVPLPDDLIGNEGLVIGKQGKNLKDITTKTGVIGVWYDSSSREFQIWSGNSRYTPPRDPSLPGRFAETGDVATADGMNTDSFGREMVRLAKTLLDDVIQHARRIVAKNKSRTPAAVAAMFPPLA